MPSDIADAVQQDQIADSLVAPIESEETAATTGTEAGEQTQDEATLTTDEQQAGQQEEADDWLPTEQEKVFPFETIAKYAARYGYTAEEIQADPRLQRTLTERLNQDIYVQQLRQQSELSQQQQEEETQQQQPTEPTRQPNVTEWLQQVDEVAKQYLNQDVANHMGNQFMKVFGSKPMTPEQSMQFSHLFTSGVINVLNSVLPNMLNHPIAEGKTFFQDVLERNFEGFGEDYQSNMYSRAWSKAVSGDPKLASLPGLNVAGSSEARAQAAQALGFTEEEFEKLKLSGKDGKPLSPYQNAVKKYTMLAKVMSGQKLTPAEANKFVEAGRKAAQKDSIQRQAGNLGSGQSKGQIASGSSDDFWKEAQAIYNQQHGSL